MLDLNEYSLYHLLVLLLLWLLLRFAWMNVCFLLWTYLFCREIINDSEIKDRFNVYYETFVIKSAYVCIVKNICKVIT